MNSDQPSVCKRKHDGPKNIWDSLPDSQAGPQRHKCAACAYEEGIREGVRRAQRAIEKIKA
jgi:hypothetical protein